MEFTVFLGSILFLLSTTCLFFYKRIKKNFIYYVFIINVLADAFVGYFNEDAIHTGIIRAILLILLIIISIKDLKYDKLFNIIYLFLLYLFTLIFFSLDILYSLSQYFKFSIALMMLPVAYSPHT